MAYFQSVCFTLLSFAGQACCFSFKLSLWRREVVLKCFMDLHEGFYGCSKRKHGSTTLLSSHMHLSASASVSCCMCICIYIGRMVDHSSKHIKRHPDLISCVSLRQSRAKVHVLVSNNNISSIDALAHHSISISRKWEVGNGQRAVVRCSAVSLPCCLSFDGAIQ